MNEAILSKLRFKEGRGAVINPPSGYYLGIETAGELEGTYDFIQLFVKDKQETEDWLPKLLPFIKDDAVFWITYPKQSSKLKTDINRNILADLIQTRTPYRPVSNVAIDETWSALRFRLKDKVKTKK